jgi:RNA polymerase sigma-70 factor (family 1)
MVTAQSNQSVTASLPSAGVSTRESMDLLFQRVVDDDYRAFEQLFRHTYRALCSYSDQLVRSPQLAEEIVDDVFCTLWGNRKRINIASSFQSYLIVSIRNRSLDCLRKAKSERHVVLEHAERVPCRQSIAHDPLIFEELSCRIDHAVNTLPEQCRLIFKMSREQDMSYKEIAGMLKISVKTVDTQIGRALKSIRRSIAVHQA